MSDGIMKYRGYSALIQYSPEDECLVGRVVGINDSVTFHGDSVAEMRKELKVAVDEYIKACGKFGKEPEKPKSGKLSLRISPELHAFVAQQSEASGRSVNQMVIDALQIAYLDNAEDAGGTRKFSRARRRKTAPGAGRKIPHVSGK